MPKIKRAEPNRCENMAVTQGTKNNALRIALLRQGRAGETDKKLYVAQSLQRHE
jgi:hypothetical protein